MYKKTKTKSLLFAGSLLTLCYGSAGSLLGEVTPRTSHLNITTGTNPINLQLGGTNTHSYADLSSSDDLVSVATNDGWIAGGISYSLEGPMGPIDVVSASGNNAVNITFAGDGVHKDGTTNSGGLLVDNSVGYIYVMRGDNYSNISAPVNIIGSSNKPLDNYDVLAKNTCNSVSWVDGMYAKSATGAWVFTNADLKVENNAKNDIAGGTSGGAVVNAANATGSFTFDDVRLTATNTVEDQIEGQNADNRALGFSCGVAANNTTAATFSFVNHSRISAISNITLAEGIGQFFGIYSAIGFEANGSSGIFTFTDTEIEAISKNYGNAIGVSAANNSSGNFTFHDATIIASSAGAGGHALGIDLKDSSAVLNFSGDNSIFSVTSVDNNGTTSNYSYDKDNNIGINVGGTSSVPSNITFGCIADEASSTTILGGIRKFHSNSTPNTVVTINDKALLNIFGECADVKEWHVNGTMILNGTSEQVLGMADIPQGKLTLAAGEVVLFGTKYDNEDKIICTSKIELNGDCDSAQLKVGEGAKFGLDLLPGDGGKLTTASVNCRVLQASNAQSIDHVKTLLGFSDYACEQIGTSGYYTIKDIDGNNYSATLVDNALTEYVDITNMRLLLSTVDNQYGAVLATVTWANESADIITSVGETEIIYANSQYAKNFANGEAASSTASIVSEVSTTLMQTVNQCPNRDDPFVILLGGHAKQDEKAGFGYNSNFYGIILGVDAVHDCKNGGTLKYGAIASFTNNNMDFFGSSTSHGKYANQKVYFGGIFGAYENINDKGLKTLINAMVGYGYTVNEMWRTDSIGDHFNGDYKGNDIYAGITCVKNLFQVGGLQVGPMASISYNRIHNQGYKESGLKENSIAKLSSVDFDFLDTIVGINAEKSFAHESNPDKLLKVFANVGWACQPIQSNSNCEASVGINSPFAPTFGYKEKNSAVASIGFRNKLNKHVDVYGGVSSQFGRDYFSISANLGLGYSF